MNWLVRQTQMRPDAVALRFEESTLTWKELHRRTDRVAAALEVAGARSGARVATLVENGPDFVALLHAAMWTGAALVPLNTRLTDFTLNEQLRDCNADLLVIDHEAANRSLELGHIRFVQVEELTYSLSTNPVTLRPGNDATILYTSGTSGTPKPVRLTWKNHMASALASALNLGLDGEDDWLCCLPMYHVGGLAIAMRSAIYGTQMTLMRRFDAARVLEALRERCTIVSLVPTMLVKLVEEAGGVEELAQTLATSRVRAILLGGGAADPALVGEAIMAGLPVFQTYGMTETSSQITTVPPDRASDKIGSAGYPIFGAELSIRSAEGEPTDDAGIVWVRGPMVASGYLDRPEDNRLKFVGGWYRTGDWGRLDDDGFLWIEGRADEMIVTGGENVAPAEVERLLLQHPRVADAAVFGTPDPVWGEIVNAAVVLRGSDEADLDAIFRDVLAPHQRPRAWHFVTELPRTSTGKIERDRIRRSYT